MNNCVGDGVYANFHTSRGLITIVILIGFILLILLISSMIFLRKKVDPQISGHIVQSGSIDKSFNKDFSVNAKFFGSSNSSNLYTGGYTMSPPFNDPDSGTIVNTIFGPNISITPFGNVALATFDGFIFSQNVSGGVMPVTTFTFTPTNPIPSTLFPSVSFTQDIFFTAESPVTPGITGTVTVTPSGIITLTVNSVTIVTGASVDGFVFYPMTVVWNILPIPSIS
jgi:hypothetical protein